MVLVSAITHFVAITRWMWWVAANYRLCSKCYGNGTSFNTVCLFFHKHAWCLILLKTCVSRKTTSTFAWTAPRVIATGSSWLTGLTKTNASLSPYSPHVWVGSVSTWLVPIESSFMIRTETQLQIFRPDSVPDVLVKHVRFVCIVSLHVAPCRRPSCADNSPKRMWPIKYWKTQRCSDSFTCKRVL